MRWETRDPVLVLAIILGVFVVVAVVLAVAFLLVFRSARGRRAAGESWRYIYGNAPLQIVDSTLSQTRDDGTVTMRLQDIVRVGLVQTRAPIVRVGNFEQSPGGEVLGRADRGSAGELRLRREAPHLTGRSGARVSRSRGLRSGRSSRTSCPVCLRPLRSIRASRRTPRAASSRRWRNATDPRGVRRNPSGWRLSGVCLWTA